MATESIIDVVSFTWDIEFTKLKSFVKDPRMEIFVCPTFYSDNQTKWTPILIKEGPGMLGFYVRLSSQQQKMADIELNFGKLHQSHFSDYRYRLFFKNTIWGYSDLLKVDDLSQHVEDGKIKCKCKMLVTRAIIKRNTGLAADLGHFLENPPFSDVEIKDETFEEPGFQAHRAILAASSNYFSGLFSEHCKGTGKTLIEIDTMIFDDLLQFMYTNYSVNLERGFDVDKLLAVADNYGLDDLVLLSEEVLCKEVDEKNAAEYLNLAECHSRRRLKEEAVKILKKIDLETSKGNASWKEACKRNPELAIQTLEDMVLKMTKKQKTNE